MSVKANGTDAKEIALEFIRYTQGRATPHIISKTIVQAKTLLSSGYTKQEVLDVMEHVITVKNIQMYSLGYINSCINDVLRELEEEKEKERLRELRKQQREVVVERKEVGTDDEERRRRNQEKARRTDIQSGFRKKFNLDMFEER